MKRNASYIPFFIGGREENLYTYTGPVPFGKSLIYAIQHFLTLFLSNATPILLVLSVQHNGIALDQSIVENGIKAALFFSCIGTIIQILPIWKIGSRLPLICGMNFAFVGALSLIASIYGFPTMFISAIIGGIFLFVIGLLGKYWSKWIKPITGAVVVLALGLSLIQVAAKQMVGLSDVPSLATAYDFAVSWPYLLMAFVALISTIVWRIVFKGFVRNLSIGIGLLAGYIVALCIPGTLDFSGIAFNKFSDFLSAPVPIFALMDFSWGDFNVGAIVVVCIIYLIEASDWIGAVSSLTNGLDGRGPSSREITGLVTGLGASSALAAVFGGMGQALYGQNIAITAENKVINRGVYLIVALMLGLSAFFPIVPRALMTIPNAVIGGVLLMLFGSIVVSGIKMIADCGFNAKNILIVTVSIGLGYGITTIPSFVDATYDAEFLNYLMLIISNPIANSFLIALPLSILLPKRMESEG